MASELSKILLLFLLRRFIKRLIYARVGRIIFCDFLLEFYGNSVEIFPKDMIDIFNVRVPDSVLA